MEQLNKVQAANFSEVHDNLQLLDGCMSSLSARGATQARAHGHCHASPACAFLDHAPGAAVQPYLAQVEELETAVGDLEHLVEALDRASWQLGKARGFVRPRRWCVPHHNAMHMMR